jgi:hypothetical protein
MVAPARAACRVISAAVAVDSMTTILIELGLPNLDVLLERCRALFVHHRAGCNNYPVRNLQVLVGNM